MSPAQKARHFVTAASGASSVPCAATVSSTSGDLAPRYSDMRSRPFSEEMFELAGEELEREFGDEPEMARAAARPDGDDPANALFGLTPGAERDDFAFTPGEGAQCRSQALPSRGAPRPLQCSSYGLDLARDCTA